jgi:hypothetical protein
LEKSRCLDMSFITTAQRQLVSGYSLEITAKDVIRLQAASGLIPAGTQIPVTYLSSESMEARNAARRFQSANELSEFLVCTGVENGPNN